MRAEPSEAVGPVEQPSSPATTHGIGLADVRAANRSCILTSLALYGPQSRVALARQTGLSRTTVGTIVGDLLREGLLREDGAVPASVVGGRRAILLRLGEAHPMLQEEATGEVVRGSDDRNADREPVSPYEHEAEEDANRLIDSHC